MNLDNTVCSPEWRICWLHLDSQACRDDDIDADNHDDDCEDNIYNYDHCCDDDRRFTWQRAEQVKYSSGKDVWAKELTSEKQNGQMN